MRSHASSSRRQSIDKQRPSAHNPLVIRSCLSRSRGERRCVGNTSRSSLRRSQRARIIGQPARLISVPQTSNIVENAMIIRASFNPHSPAWVTSKAAIRNGGEAALRPFPHSSCHSIEQTPAVQCRQLTSTSLVAFSIPLSLRPGGTRGS